MADVKWIKIVTDIFDDEKILLIESMPDADSIIVIWFKLLCLAGKTNNGGVFIMSNQIPYTEEMLATIFRRKLSTVQLALQTFEKFGMVEIIDNVITIPNWGKHQTLDQLEERKEYMRKYMANYRAKQKLLAEKSGKVNSKVNSKANSKVNVNTLEEDKEEDKEKDKDKEEDNNIILPFGSMSAAADSKELHSVDYTNIMDYWNKHSKLKPISAVTDKRKRHLSARFKEHGLQAIYKVIDNTSKSSFMRGKNSRGWIATFDWVFLPNNFVKVLEGNYLDKDITTKITDDITRRVEALYGGVGRD